MTPPMAYLIAVLFVGIIGISAALFGFWLKKHDKH